MPSLPDLPGKGLVTETTKRARVLAVGAGIGAIGLAAGALKKALGHEAAQRADAEDPIAETPTAPPGAEEKPVPSTAPVRAVPEPKPAKPAPKPKPAKAKAAKSKPPKAKSKAKAKAKPAKAKKAAPKPPAPTGTDAPAKPKAEPGNISVDRDHPHRALNNPVGDPDETEYPDPFEKRSDPRDPPDPDGKPFGEEPHPQTGSESTSEPPLSQDPEAPRGGKPPKRENLAD